MAVNTGTVDLASQVKKRPWDTDLFSSLSIMSMRAGMLAAKFVLSLFVARYMGLEELGIYGLLVGASGTIQAILRGGIFALISRTIVGQSIPDLVHDLRHYITAIMMLYLLLLPVAAVAGIYLGFPHLAILAVAVFMTEHLAFDSYIIINNLQYPKMANFVYSLQSAAWIYLFVIFAFLFPSLRTLESLLSFWAAGGLIAIGIAIWLSRFWPWRDAFSKKLNLEWYSIKMRQSANLYFSTVLGVVNYYLDRYIVSLVLNLEMTGVYVFFSQIVTATWNLVNSGVLVIYAPRLIKAYDASNMAPFNALYRLCLSRALYATFMLSIMSAAIVPFMATFAGKPMLLNHLPLLWILLGALFFRITATSAGSGLFAMSKDRENFHIEVIWFLITATLGTAAVITLGIYGIALNTAVVSIASIIYARLAWKKETVKSVPLSTNSAVNQSALSYNQPSPRKKNILIISSAFPPHVFGGAEVAAYNRAKLLAKRGHTVNVATLHEQEATPAWGELTPEGFRLYRLKYPRGYTLFGRTRNNKVWKKVVWHLQDYFDSRNRKLIKQLLDEVKPDHIDIDNLVGFGFNTLAEIGNRNISVAYILHDLNLACFNTCMFRAGATCKKQCISCRGVAVLRQAHLKKIDRLGFISPSRTNLESAKKYIPAARKTPSCVIRNVPECLPKPIARQPSDKVRLLFAGRLDPVKGIEFLLKTLDSISAVYDFHLTVLGTGPIETRLRTRFGHRKWVTFRGFVPGTEVTQAIMQSDVYCIPSLMAETYGLVTAQALQLGTPVIGSSVGGTTELIRDGITGLLLPPGDSLAWRAGFLKIFSDRTILAKWQENAINHAREFDENLIGSAHEDFIENLSYKAA